MSDNVFGYDTVKERYKDSIKSIDVSNDFSRDIDTNTFLAAYSKISKTANWQAADVSTVQGAGEVAAGFLGCGYDGRYVYYCASNSNTFIRFDTEGVGFAVVGGWETCSMSTAQGATSLDTAYQGVTFDGRYVYFTPYDAATVLRFDSHATFAAAWETVSITTVGGTTDGNMFTGAGAFDGRYIYLAPSDSATFVQYDTKASFTAVASWDTMNVSTALGAATVATAFGGTVFDGQYVYFMPLDSLTMVRYNTQGTSFTTTADWEQMSLSTAMGASATVLDFWGGCFDGRYIYLAQHSGNTFMRFDTSKSFTDAGSWDTIATSSVGGSTAASQFTGAIFDGRYVYFTPFSATTFIKFDTLGDFNTIGDWSQIDLSTAKGAAASGSDFLGEPAYDGKFVYFPSYTSDVVMRTQACPR